MRQGTKPYRGWEYARVGDYHRNLDPNWSYTPTYLRKMAFVRQFIESLPRDVKILDAGCGEGVLFDEFHRKGWDIEGLDLNYENEFVRRGDVRNMPYPDASFDLILLLDTLEHLAYEDQPKCLAEMQRVLKPTGQMVVSVPNLAHLNSRIRFLVRGKLDRTDVETNHVGERPLGEYEQLLRNVGFMISDRVGITFTLPWLYRRVICRYPARLRWLHDLLEPLAKALPALSMLTIFVCKKGSEPAENGRLSMVKRLKIIAQSKAGHLFSVFTHLTERERALLFEMARSLPLQGTVVEIGSYLGASTCFLAAGARLRDGKIYAVDTWTNLAMSEGPRDTYEEFLRNTAPLKDWIVPFRGLSTDIARQFHREIDLLFIDGDHSYEAVRADLEAWLPKVKDGCIVVFHDYNWAEGVRQAVREFIVPIQVEGGHRLDTIYWTRISRTEKERRRFVIPASVIVPTYERLVYLKDTLVSLLQQKLPADRHEIIVVDNKPTGDVYRMVHELGQEWKRAIRYVEEPNVGLHNARHAGAQAALGQILIYVDDDVIAHPEWLSAILGPFEDPSVAIVGGKVLPKWETQPPDWFSQFPQSYLSLLDLGQERMELKWPETVYGCNLAIRRSVLYEVGGFNPDAMGDPRFVWLRGDGETGLCKKVYDAGYNLIYEPGACVWHRIPAARVEARAFYHRGLMVGLSLSYSHIRETAGRRFFTLKVIYRSFFAFLRTIRWCIRAIFQQDKRVRCISDAWRWCGYGMQHMGAALNPRLRAFLLKDSYFLS